MKLLCEIGRTRLRIPISKHLRLLGLLRQVDLLDSLMRRPIDKLRRRRHFLYLFLLRRHDAFQRRVANLANARLDRQQGRQRHLVPLIPTTLELSLHAQLVSRSIEFDYDRRMRQSSSSAMITPVCP